MSRKPVTMDEVIESLEDDLRHVKDAKTRLSIIKQLVDLGALTAGGVKQTMERRVQEALELVDLLLERKRKGVRKGMELPPPPE